MWCWNDLDKADLGMNSLGKRELGGESGISLRVAFLGVLNAVRCVL